MQMTRGDIATRIAALSDEIRTYPGPIARCDQHLPALLEERSNLIRELQERPSCTPLGIWDNEGGFHAA
jgi:hypothetical protein